MVADSTHLETCVRAQRNANARPSEPVLRHHPPVEEVEAIRARTKHDAKGVGTRTAMSRTISQRGWTRPGDRLAGATRCRCGGGGGSALYTCFVMLARAVEHLSESHKLKWSYHDLWWVRHIMPQQHDA